MGRIVTIAEELGAMVVASVALIVLALIYFIATVWIVTVGAQVVVGSKPSSDFAVVAAALLTLSGLVGSRMR